MRPPTHPRAGRTACRPRTFGDVPRRALREKVTDVEVAYGQVTVTVDARGARRRRPVLQGGREAGLTSGSSTARSTSPRRASPSSSALLHGAPPPHPPARGRPGGATSRPADDHRRSTAGRTGHERETYDMFGIEFEGHPGLLPRILTVENFEGWPLRKEFLLMTREAKPWPGARNRPRRPTRAPAAGRARRRPPATPRSPRGQGRRRQGQGRAGQGQGRRGPQAQGGRARRGRAGARRGRGRRWTGRGPAGRGRARRRPGRRRRRRAGRHPRRDDPRGCCRGRGQRHREGRRRRSGRRRHRRRGPGDAPGAEQPVDDPEHEAKLGEGGAPAPSGTPASSSRVGTPAPRSSPAASRPPRPPA
jgi:hypothetical protein